MGIEGQFLVAVRRTFPQAFSKEIMVSQQIKLTPTSIAAARKDAVLIRIHFNHFRKRSEGSRGRFHSKLVRHSERDWKAGSTAKQVLTLAMDSPSC